MKNIFLCILFISGNLLCYSQTKKKHPSISYSYFVGWKKSVDTKTFNNDGKPIVISFWATWCKPCAKELDAITEVYDDWQEETGVKVFAVSIDDSRNANKVAPFANGKDWPFEIYMDANQDLKEP